MSSAAHIGSAHRPSILAIAWSDLISFWSMLVPIICWVFYLVLAVFGDLPGIGRHQPIRASTGMPFFLQLGIIASCIGVAVLAWRVLSIRALFAHGVEVPGNITDLSFYRDRGRVEYSYTFEGQAYGGGNAVMKNGRTTALQPGRVVMLLVDPKKPARALVRELFV